jgi:putative endonuclease
MAEIHLLGQKGEETAAGYLSEKGYKILFMNWKYGKHEIDIIAAKDDFIVFVEVKFRSDELMVPLGTVISKEKQRSLIYAAEGYIRRFAIDKESRFDVITIIGKEDEEKIDHIEDAFYPTLR